MSIAVIWEGAARSLCQVDAEHLWLGEISTKIPRQIIDDMHQELDVGMPGRKRTAAIRYLDLNEKQRSGVWEAVFHALERMREVRGR